MENFPLANLSFLVKPSSIPLVALILSLAIVNQVFDIFLESSLGFFPLHKQQISPSLIVNMSSTTTQDNVKNLASKAWSNSSVSDIYEQIRPDYNLDSVEFLLRQLGALQQRSDEFVIAELGAGTGKYTRAMIKVLEQNSSRENVKIIATEPLREMCEKFKEMVPGVKILQCAANNIGKI